MVHLWVHGTLDFPQRLRPCRAEDAVVVTMACPVGDFLVPPGNLWVMELHPGKAQDDGVLGCDSYEKGDLQLMEHTDL